MPDDRVEPDRRRKRIWPLLLGAAACLLIGFAGWVYQGYHEDYDEGPGTQSWPIGLIGYGTAGLLLLLALRRARPELTGTRLAIAVVCLTLGLVGAAIGSIDAGNG